MNRQSLIETLARPLPGVLSAPFRAGEEPACETSHRARGRCNCPKCALSRAARAALCRIAEATITQGLAGPGDRDSVWHLALRGVNGKIASFNVYAGPANLSGFAWHFLFLLAREAVIALDFGPETEKDNVDLYASEFDCHEPGEARVGLARCNKTLAELRRLGFTRRELLALDSAFPLVF